MFSLIDTHAHLTHEDYSDVAGVLERAKQVGVMQCVVPGLDSTSSRKAIELAQKYPQILPAVGLHPLSASENLEAFRELAALPQVVAIGEIGTDAKAGEMKEQEKRLRFFLELAIETAKPALVHIRDTWQETLVILADYPELKNQAVIHCFTGGYKEAEAIQKLGLFISCTAIIARESLASTREVIKSWPLEQLMLETDCPWLSWPGEKWPNEPKTVAQIAQKIAEIKGISVEEVAQQTTHAANKFFNITPQIL